MSVIDADLQTSPLSIYSQNPTNTLFNKIYGQRLTHHNRWLETVDCVINQPIEITDLHLRNIHEFRNVCCIYRVFLNPFNPDMDVFFNSIMRFKVSLDINGHNQEHVTLLDVPGYVLQAILKCDNRVYMDIIRIYIDTGDLLIPIDALLFNQTWLPSYTRMTIECTFPTPVPSIIQSSKVGIEMVTLTSWEAVKVNNTAKSLHVKRYHFEHHELLEENPQPRHMSSYVIGYNERTRVIKEHMFDVTVCLPVKTILALPDAPRDPTAITTPHVIEKHLEGFGVTLIYDIKTPQTTTTTMSMSMSMSMCHSRSYNLYCDHVDHPLCLNLCVDQSTHFIPTGAFIPTKDKNPKIKVVNRDLSGFTLIYICVDSLMMSSEELQFHGLLTQRSHAGNSYPLRWVSPHECFEGYWFPLDPNERDYELMYPKPLATETKVDEVFLNRLKELTANEAKCINCWGCSVCRLCQQSNGSAEYTLINGGVSFRYPEGLIHYYEHHNVQPSKEFYDCVMNYPMGELL